MGNYGSLTGSSFLVGESGNARADGVEKLMGEVMEL